MTILIALVLLGSSQFFLVLFLVLRNGISGVLPDSATNGATPSSLPSGMRISNLLLLDYLISLTNPLSTFLS